MVRVRTIQHSQASRERKRKLSFPFVVEPACVLRSGGCVANVSPQQHSQARALAKAFVSISIRCWTCLVLRSGGCVANVSPQQSIYMYLPRRSVDSKKRLFFCCISSPVACRYVPVACRYVPVACRFPPVACRYIAACAGERCSVSVQLLSSAFQRSLVQGHRR